MLFWRQGRTPTIPSDGVVGDKDPTFPLSYDPFVRSQYILVKKTYIALCQQRLHFHTLFFTYKFSYAGVQTFPRKLLPIWQNLIMGIDTHLLTQLEMMAYNVFLVVQLEWMWFGQRHYERSVCLCRVTLDLLRCSQNSLFSLFSLPTTLKHLCTALTFSYLREQITGIYVCRLHDIIRKCTCPFSVDIVSCSSSHESHLFKTSITEWIKSMVNAQILREIHP